MAVYGYTKNYKLIKPQFDTDTWHDYEYDNLDTIDAVLSAIFASGDWQGFWKTNTHYDAGGVVIDRVTDTMYKIMVEHTTSEATFAAEFAAHPTYYELWSPNNLAEDWAIKMDGTVSNTDYSSKAYAISSALIDNGSAKEWAINSGTIGTTGEYSAKKYATDAHNDYISMTTDPNVVAVGTNIASVNTVSASISGVNTTASNISSINTVAGDISRVNLVADDIASVHTVAIDISNVIDVAANKTNIDTVAGISADVSTTAAVATSIPTVADNDANITTVATNISDVNTAATNMAAIQAAPTAASNAAASATLAQEWATKMDGQVASIDYSSKYYAGQSATSASNSHVWAEGTDEQVQALGGVHSSKVWAEQSTNANIALTNSPYTTNRILEIPQDIKLELNNGTLTLKAGSKVYVPNGFESDGVTPKFDVVTIESDATLSSMGSASNQCFIFWDKIHNEFGYINRTEPISGSTPPTNGVIYNTSTNEIRYYESGTMFNKLYSFPIALVTRTSGVPSSLDSILNGFGYIGSTVFALPGVKGLAPNGRDANGTCITEIKENTTVKVFSNTVARYDVTYLLLGDSAQFLTSYEYDADSNRIRNTYNNSNVDGVFAAAIFTFNSSSPYKITSFSPFTVDSVANSNASNFSQAGRSYLSGLGMPSSRYVALTLGASGSTYIAPANGYFIMSGVATTANAYVYFVGASMNPRFYSPLSGGTAAGFCPAKKGQSFRIDYVNINASANTTVFRFVYAEGEN